MKKVWMLLGLVAMLSLQSSRMVAAGPEDGKLHVYFIDVEGGQSTLFVTPTHQSLLIDTGWAGHDSRDADRIVAAAHKAGLQRIDYVLITHFHDDHVGGVPQLVAKIPVGTFIDHGTNSEPVGNTEKDYEAYQKVLATGAYHHLQPHPGDMLPLTGVQVKVITSDGKFIDKPLPGAGQPNPFCASSEIRPTDKTENSHSLGVELTFGSLRILDLGDLTWDKERELMCPDNRLGKVDVLVISHHGWYQSSSPALIAAVAPRVAVMDNGATKGGSIPTFKNLQQITGLEALWQLHYSDEAGATYNTKPEYIANPQGADAGLGLELTGSKDGNFEIVNGRTGKSVSYAKKGR